MFNISELSEFSGGIKKDVEKLKEKILTLVSDKLLQTGDLNLESEVFSVNYVTDRTNCTLV